MELRVHPWKCVGGSPWVVEEDPECQRAQTATQI